MKEKVVLKRVHLDKKLLIMELSIFVVLLFKYPCLCRRDIFPGKMLVVLISWQLAKFRCYKLLEKYSLPKWGRKLKGKYITLL